MAYDITYFLLALEQVGDLDMGALALVESAWQSSPTRMHGWVLALMSGQRYYLEMEMPDVEDSLPTDVEITPLVGHQRYPDELDGCVWYRPDNINRHLGLAGRFVH
jgi:hypothetical protein